MDHPFPFLKASGSHRDIGRAIGERFATEIHHFIDHLKEVCLEHQNAPANIQPYFTQTRARFPNLVEELEGIAQGAGMALEEVFFANCAELHPYATSPDHCTGIITRDRVTGEFIGGHNEDNPPGAGDYLYILDATVDGTRIVGLNYMVEVPGTSAAINSWGLYQGINTVHPSTRIGIPKNLIARAVLDCHSLDEAEKVIIESNNASGFNHMLVAKEGYIDIAVALDEHEVDRGTATPYAHTNHYLSGKGRAHEAYLTKNSLERYNQASNVAKPRMTKEELVAALSSCDASQFTQSAWHDSTLAAVICCPATKTIEITNKKTSLSHAYTL